MRSSALLFAFALSACSTPDPAPPAPPATPTPSPVAPAASPSSPAEPLTPAEFQPDWDETEGWHAIAKLPAIQRRPLALAASRSAQRVLVLGPRGRRVTIVEPGLDPWHIKLPVDIDAADVGLDETKTPPQMVVTSAKQRVLVRIALEEGGGELSRASLKPGRTVLEGLPDGGVDLLDGMLRVEGDNATVRGVLAPSGQRYRGVKQDTLVGIVGSGPKGRRMAMLTRIPKASVVRVLGMDPPPEMAIGDRGAEDQQLDTGWLAAWTGQEVTRRLHFVRFDADGRVLFTAPAPKTTPAPPPEGFDLRVALMPERQLVLALPGEGGWRLWRYLPGPDGQRLSIEGLAPGPAGD